MTNLPKAVSKTAAYTLCTAELTHNLSIEGPNFDHLPTSGLPIGRFMIHFKIAFVIFLQDSFRLKFEQHDAEVQG